MNNLNFKLILIMSIPNFPRSISSSPMEVTPSPISSLDEHKRKFEEIETLDEWFDWLTPQEKKSRAPLFKELSAQFYKTAQADERHELLDQAGSLIIQSISPNSPFNFQQFMQMHLSPETKNTSFAGCEGNASLEFWTFFFNHLKQEESFFIQLNMKHELLDTELSMLQEMKKYLELFESCKNDSVNNFGLTSDDELKENLCLKGAEQFQEYVKNDLQRYGYTYIPIGYFGDEISSGHSIILKLLYGPNKESVTAFLLNRGDGMQYHPVLELDEFGSKYDYRSFPFQLDPTWLFSDLGQTNFFLRLFRIRVEKAPYGCPYTAHSIYALLAFVGIPLTNEYTGIPVQEQKGPNCSEYGIQTAIRDLLNDKGLKKAFTRKLLLGGRFYSLAASYPYFQAHKETQETQYILRKALQKFAYWIDKSSSHYFTEEEFFLNHALYRKMVGLLTQSSLAKETSLTLPVQFSTIFKDQIVFSRKGFSEINNKNARSNYSPIETPRLDPKEAKENFSKWILIAKQLYAAENYKDVTLFIYRAFLSLPIPQPFSEWDRLPAEDSHFILESLCEHVGLFLKSLRLEDGGEQEVREEQARVITVYTAYAIGDYLARKNPQTRLENFAPQYWINDCPFDHINLGFLSQRYEEIKNYFLNISRGKMPLFDFSPIIDISNKRRAFEYPRDQNRISDPVQATFFYLFQFLEEAYKKGLEKKKYPDMALATLWVDRKGRYLPYESCKLHALSLYAYAMKSKSFIIDTDGLSDIQIEGDEENVILNIELCREAKNSTPDPLDTEIEGIFNREVKEENQTICITDNLSNFSKSEIRTILRMRLEPSLRIHSMLDWFKGHILHLHDEKWQRILERIFFESNVLLKTIKECPSIVTELRQAILEALRTYLDKPQSLETLLFLFRFAYSVETHIQEVRSEEVSAKERITYLQMASQLAQSNLNQPEYEEILWHLILMLGLQKKGSIDLTFQLQQARFALKIREMVDATTTWWQLEGQRIMEEFTAQLPQRDEISNPSSFCRAILTFAFPTSPIRASEEWSGQYPLFSCREYKIDFHQASIQRDNQEIKILGPLWKQKLCKNDAFLFKIISSKNEEFKFDPLKGSMLSHDNQIEIFTNGTVLHFWSTVHGPNWYNYFPSFAAHLGRNPIKEFLISRCPDVCIWSSKSMKEDQGDNVSLIMDKTSEKILYSCHQNNSSSELIRTLPNGEETADKMINPIDLPKENPLRPLLLLKGSACFYNSEKQSIQSLHLFNCQLNFFAEEGRLRCKEFPEYFLSSQQPIPALSMIEGYLVIENEIEKKVCIPSCEFLCSSKNFLNQITFNKNFTLENSYFIYTYNEEEDHLSSESAEANLFLSCLFAAKRNYITAYNYLLQTRSFQPEKLLFIFNKHFKQIPHSTQNIYSHHNWLLDIFRDGSAEALAFYMQLFLCLIGNFNQSKDRAVLFKRYILIGGLKSISLI